MSNEFDLDMTREDEIKIAKLIRQETGCGLAEAASAFGKLLDALKRHPKPVFGHQPYKLKVEWEYDDND